jgi:hypothetical protein
LSTDAVASYLAGTLDVAEKQGLRGRILELQELCGLKLGDIQRFYGVAPQAKKPDSKS